MARKNTGITGGIEMNKCLLIGRLTKDPELKFTAGSGIGVATFTLAVDRSYAGQNGEKQTDFIPIVCWRKLAENVANYSGKGRLVAVSGEIQIRKYQDKDGNNRYATEVVADSVQFLDKAKDGGQSTQSQPVEQGTAGEFKPVEGDDDSIPF